MSTPPSMRPPGGPARAFTGLAWLIAAGLVWPSVGLFVLMLIQTGLGQAMSDSAANALIAAHVPVAVLLMAVAMYVALASTRPEQSK